MRHLADTLYLLDRPWMDRAATAEEEAEYARMEDEMYDAEQQDAITEREAAEYAAWDDEAFAGVALMEEGR